MSKYRPTISDDLCLLSEAILYRPLSSGGKIFVVVRISEVKHAMVKSFGDTWFVRSLVPSPL